MIPDWVRLGRYKDIEIFLAGDSKRNLYLVCVDTKTFKREIQKIDKYARTLFDSFIEALYRIELPDEGGKEVQNDIQNER